jgi:general secretion pathway protein K
VAYSSQKQAGVALLAAILLLVTATAIIVSITHEQAFAIRKTSRIHLADRARLYALGLEDWAQIYLKNDRQDSEVDHLGEDWAVGVPGLPIEGGFLSGYMEDEQSRLNINGLLNSEVSVNRFVRLCNNLEVDPSFIPALMDWIDVDFDVRYPDGAEEHYENYRVANRPMVDISELLLVKNVTPEIYNRLKPYITVLPVTTNINVNTMSEAVFMSLGENLKAKDLVDAREEEEFSSVQDFIDRLQLPLEVAGLSTNTDYFRAHGQVTQGDLVLSLDSLLHRDANGNTSVISRTLGQF